MAERERMSLEDAFAVADSLRESAVALVGRGFTEDRDEDLRDLIALKQLLLRADGSWRAPSH